MVWHDGCQQELIRQLVMWRQRSRAARGGVGWRDGGGMTRENEFRTTRECHVQHFGATKFLLSCQSLQIFLRTGVLKHVSNVECKDIATLLTLFGHHRQQFRGSALGHSISYSAQLRRVPLSSLPLSHFPTTISEVRSAYPTLSTTSTREKIKKRRRAQRDSGFPMPSFLPGYTINNHRLE